ncbi:MAG: 50S ribosomal protein L3 [Candidatus Binatia bacterium]
MNGVIGKKLGMTQVFDAAGQAVPVTVLEATPCTVVRIRTDATDGYNAIQVGTGKKKEKRITKAEKGQMGPGGRSDFATLAEFRVGEPGDFEVGQEIKLSDVFKPGDVVDVSGRSKGRGFAGVVKRYGFAGQSATHGTHESFRGTGGIGACAYPGRVFKGKKMPGHMGAARTTVQNLEVVDVRVEEHLILIRGGVPGARNGRVIIRHAVKA